MFASGNAFRPFVPPAGAVLRPRLPAPAPGRHKLVTIVGPPGSGKTVLLAQWALASRGRRVRWLTLGPRHDDPRQLARDLVAALVPPWQPGPPALRAGPVPGEPGLGPTFLAALRPALRDLPPTTLVLDDVHALTRLDLLDDLSRLVQDRARPLQVLVASQADPPLRLHRLAVAGELVQIGPDELAFTAAEAAALLDAAGVQGLPPRLVDALVSRTEGWAAGLSLAAAALAGQPDADRLATAFDGDHPGVRDYLAGRLLDEQPEPVRRFLLLTGVLDDLNGQLANFVTGHVGGQAMLESLESRSLFVERLTGRPRWFRYHPMVRTLLRQRLREEDPALERALLLRAADWHLARRSLATGVRYLAEAQEWGGILDAAFTHGGDLHLQGRSGVVAGWIELVPDAVRRHVVRAQLVHAGALIASGEPAAALSVLDGARERTSTSGAVAVVAELLRAWAALGQGRSADAVAGTGRVLAALAATADAPALLPDVLGLTGAAADALAGARLLRGVALLYEGQPGPARASLLAACDEGPVLWHVAALGALALAEAGAGELSAAEHDASQALQVAAELGLDAHPGLGHAHLALARVARERGDAARAARLLDAAAPVAGPADAVLPGLLRCERALLALATEGADAGLAVLAEEDRDLTGPPPPPALDNARATVEARLLLAAGDPGRAELAVGAAASESAEVLAIKVRLAVERGDRAGARTLLGRWPAGRGRRSELQRAMWGAVVAHLDGDPGAARAMAEVVREAERERDVGVLRAGGRVPMALARALQRQDPAPFLRAVLDAPEAPPVRRSTGLVEGLTERESAVLALLAQPLSTGDIADRLGVSPNTVKTHLKHIYRKLAVAGRSEAVDAALRLELL